MTKSRIARLLSVTDWVSAASILARLDLDIPYRELPTNEAKAVFQSIWNEEPDAELVLAHSVLESWGQGGLRELSQFSGRALNIQVEPEDVEKHSELLSWWLEKGFGLHLWLAGPLKDSEKNRIAQFHSERIEYVYVYNLACPLPAVEQMIDEGAFIWFPPPPYESYEFVKAREFFIWRQRNPDLEHRLLFYQGLNGEPLSSQSSLYFHDGTTDPLGRAETTFYEWLLVRWLLKLRERGPRWLYRFLYSVLDFKTQSPSLRLRNMTFRLPVKIVQLVFRKES